MSFGDHLDELRSRMFKALVVPAPLGLALFFVAPYMREILISPLFAALRANGQPCQIQALSPGETITTDMKLAFVGALTISAPWLLYQLWKFIEPGLYMKERRYVRFLTPLSAVLSVGGVLLFYWILLPFALMFLVGFGTAPARKTDVPPPMTAATDPSAPPPPFVFPVLEEDPVSPQPGQVWVAPKNQVLRIAVPLQKFAPNAIVEFAGDLSNTVSAAASGQTVSTSPQLSILEVPLTVVGGISQVYRLSEYIDFTLLLLASSVLAFQMPALILLLGWIGFVSPSFLRKHRRWAYFILVIIAALVAPPDITSMFLMLAPLLLLYELGIILLIVVPAHKVAEGRVFSVDRQAKKPAQTAQTNRSSDDSDQDDYDDWHTRPNKDDESERGS